MARRILKYPLEHALIQTIDTPKVWRPLAFKNQNGTATVWADSDATTEVVQRVIYLAMTGEATPENAKYIGTEFFGASKEIVIHCFVGSS
jgi:hypothetical protein